MINKIICLLFLVAGGFAASSQNIEVNTADASTGSRLLMTNNKRGLEFNIEDSVAREGALFFAVGYQGNSKDKKPETYFIDLDMVHNNNKLGCIEQFTSKALLSLEDGTVIECFQISDPDCGATSFKGAFALMAKGGKAVDMAANFQKLQTTAISKVKVFTTEGVLKYKIKKKDKEYLKKHFALVDQAVKRPAK